MLRKSYGLRVMNRDPSGRLWTQGFVKGAKQEEFPFRCPDTKITEKEFMLKYL